MSTGIIYLMAKGMQSILPPNLPGYCEEILFNCWKHELAFESISPTGGKVKKGLCGAPIVQNDEAGGVAGFFHLTNGKQRFSPILDDLIHQGWAIV